MKLKYLVQICIFYMLINKVIASGPASLSNELYQYMDYHSIFNQDSLLNKIRFLNTQNNECTKIEILDESSQLDENSQIKLRRKSNIYKKTGVPSLEMERDQLDSQLILDKHSSESPVTNWKIPCFNTLPIYQSLANHKKDLESEFTGTSEDIDNALVTLFRKNKL